MTQIKTRPPTFALFVSRPADLPESLRYLTTGLRQDFGLRGIPIRMVMRKVKSMPRDDKASSNLLQIDQKRAKAINHRDVFDLFGNGMGHARTGASRM